jgi:hypothetical protein
MEAVVRPMEAVVRPMEAVVRPMEADDRTGCSRGGCRVC